MQKDIMKLWWNFIGRRPRNLTWSMRKLITGWYMKRGSIALDDVMNPDDVIFVSSRIVTPDGAPPWIEVATWDVTVMANDQIRIGGFGNCGNVIDGSTWNEVKIGPSSDAQLILDAEAARELAYNDQRNLVALYNKRNTQSAWGDDDQRKLERLHRQLNRLLPPLPSVMRIVDEVYGDAVMASSLFRTWAARQASIYGWVPNEHELITGEALDKVVDAEVLPSADGRVLYFPAESVPNAFGQGAVLDMRALLGAHLINDRGHRGPRAPEREIVLNRSRIYVWQEVLDGDVRGGRYSLSDALYKLREPENEEEAEAAPTSVEEEAP